MFGTDRPKYIRPGNEPLYPVRSKDGNIDLLIKPDSDSALAADRDAKTDFVYNRYHHLPLETQQQKLPIFQYRNHILYLLETNQTLVLVGETGSGKSTQVPQEDGAVSPVLVQLGSGLSQVRRGPLWSGEGV